MPRYQEFCALKYIRPQKQLMIRTHSSSWKKRRDRRASCIDICTYVHMTNRNYDNSASTSFRLFVVYREKLIYKIKM